MSLLDKKIERVLALKTDSPEMHNAMAALSTFYGSKGNTLEARRSLRVDLEGRSLSLSQDFVAQFADFQRSLETVEETVQSMKRQCAAVFEEIEATEQATARFLQRTRDLNTVRDAQKKNVENMRSFILKFKLSDAEIQTLLDAPLSRATLKKFIETLSQLEDMKEHCAQLLSMSATAGGGGGVGAAAAAAATARTAPFAAAAAAAAAAEGAGSGAPESHSEHAPLEIFNAVSKYHDQAYSRLFEWLSTECAHCFSAARPSVDEALLHAFRKLRSRPPAFMHHIEGVVVGARSQAVVGAFRAALNTGGPQGVPQRMEDHGGNPVRFVNDILAWCHQQIAGEKELCSSIFDARGGRGGGGAPTTDEEDSNAGRRFASIFEGLAAAVAPRFQRVLQELTVRDVVPAFRLWKLFGFYAQMTRELLRVRPGRPAPHGRTGPGDGGDASAGSAGGDPLTAALCETAGKAKLAFMALARQRADAMLETIATAPASLNVSSVVESSLSDLDEILRQEASSLTAGDGNAASDQHDGSNSNIDAVLDLFLHPMLRTSLRSAKSLDATHTALFMVNNAHAMRLALDPYPFARNWAEKVAHERDSWRQLLVVELAGSVLAQCDLTQFLERCRAVLDHNRSAAGGGGAPAELPPRLSAHTDAAALKGKMKQFYNALFSLTVPVLQHVSDPSLRSETQQAVYASLVKAHDAIYRAVADSERSGYAAPKEILLHTPAQIEVLLK